MAIDPKDHPLHKVPEHLPRPPGDLPPGSAPSQPPPAAVPSPDGTGPYAGEVENEAGDPVGKPPRL
jgi:hypothetical protein